MLSFDVRIIIVLCETATARVGLAGYILGAVANVSTLTATPSI